MSGLAWARRSWHWLASGAVLASLLLLGGLRAFDPRREELPADRYASAMMERLHLPALPASHDPETGSSWRAITPERGVYARNLAILRRAPGVALLLEGPCVNERHEYQRLQQTDLEIDGHRYPSRVADYANAIVDSFRVRE
jgi:hypothetical protein